MASTVLQKNICAVSYCRRLFHISILRKFTITPGTCIARSKESEREKSTHWFEDLQAPWKTPEALVEYFSKNILFQDDHIIAVNKPNGLPMHAAKYMETSEDVEAPMIDELSVFSILPALQKKLNVGPLSEIYSQNRLFSGVVIFTKTEKANTIMKKYFRHVRANKVQFQNFWAVTVGLPDPPAGEEEMGLQRQQIAEWNLAVKVKGPGVRKRRTREAIKPSFRYKLLNSFKTSQSKTGLVEISATSTKWDSLQLFLLHKKAPILGDHKYSSRLKMVLGTPVLMNPSSCVPSPQVIPFDLCQILGLKERQTHNIPLHVHCKTVIVPQIGKRQSTLTIEAPLPDMFEHTLGSLKQAKSVT